MTLHWKIERVGDRCGAREDEDHAEDAEVAEPVSHCETS